MARLRSGPTAAPSEPVVPLGSQAGSSSHAVDNRQLYRRTSQADSVESLPFFDALDDTGLGTAENDPELGRCDARCDRHPESLTDLETKLDRLELQTCGQRNGSQSSQNSQSSSQISYPFLDGLIREVKSQPSLSSQTSYDTEDESPVPITRRKHSLQPLQSQILSSHDVEFTTRRKLIQSPGTVSSGTREHHYSISSSDSEQETTDDLGSFIVDDDVYMSDTASDTNLDNDILDYATPVKRKAATRGPRKLVQRSITPPPPRHSPSTRLVSPRKKISRIPTPPGRPSVDVFWDPEHINRWNDHHSPQKVVMSPRKNRDVRPATHASKKKKEQRRGFDANKVRLAEDFLRELDDRVADGQIAKSTAGTGGVHIIWSKTLRRTAGKAKLRYTKDPTSHRPETSHNLPHATIELADKIIDDEDRLRNTLAHEFCHLTNYLISNVKNQPHGASFRAWGHRVMAEFGASHNISVTRCHSYAIDYKYIWICTNTGCGKEYKRHSKSIDPTRHWCGRCPKGEGLLEQIQPAPRGAVNAHDHRDRHPVPTDGPSGAMIQHLDASTPPSTRVSPKKAAPGKYAVFVKENYAAVRSLLPPGSPQKQVMQALGEEYRRTKGQEQALPTGAATLIVRGSHSGDQDTDPSGVEVIDVDATDSPPTQSPQTQRRRRIGPKPASIESRVLPAGTSQRRAAEHVEVVDLTQDDPHERVSLQSGSASASEAGSGEPSDSDAIDAAIRGVNEAFGRVLIRG